MYTIAVLLGVKSVETRRVFPVYYCVVIPGIELLIVITVGTKHWEPESSLGLETCTAVRYYVKALRHGEFFPFTV